MDINIAICDDEHTETIHLASLVREWAKERGVNIRIAGFDSAENFLFAYEDNKAFDILLLDIQLMNMDGVALARKIREEDENIQIIFITGYMDYITDGYEVEALHYLLKPVVKEKFFSVLNRAVEKLKKNEQTLMLSLTGQTIRLPLREIIYLEVQRNYVTLHAKESFTIKAALTTPEIDLCIIIGNLFDNAIEASLALPESNRMIRIFMEMKGSQLYMSFTNLTATKKLRKKTENS